MKLKQLDASLARQLLEHGRSVSKKANQYSSFDRPYKEKQKKKICLVFEEAVDVPRR
jgi:hypothetical protein